MSEYLNEMIGYQVESTAEWRRRKAEQFPDDSRNMVAAEELKKLAAQIDQIGELEPIHHQITELHERLVAADDSGDPARNIGESVSEELRSIGFHGGYATGLELLEWYRDLLQETLDEVLDDAVPTPANPERQQLQQKISVLIRQQEANPDELARAAVEAVFDHLLNPPELDREAGPFEEEVHQVEAKLIRFISDEAADLCAFIRSRSRP